MSATQRWPQSLPDGCVGRCANVFQHPCGGLLGQGNGRRSAPKSPSPISKARRGSSELPRWGFQQPSVRSSSEFPHRSLVRPAPLGERQTASTAGIQDGATSPGFLALPPSEPRSTWTRDAGAAPRKVDPNGLNEVADSGASGYPPAGATPGSPVPNYFGSERTHPA